MSLISIHAPAWGATDAVVRAMSGLTISIHAPAWGATTDGYYGLYILRFQSTPPRGGRLRSQPGIQGLQNFNPRPRVGGD